METTQLKVTWHCVVHCVLNGGDDVTVRSVLVQKVVLPGGLEWLSAHDEDYGVLYYYSSCECCSTDNNVPVGSSGYCAKCGLLCRSCANEDEM